MTSLQVIKPLAITASILTATDVLENDYAAIANSHAYVLTDRVISTSTHKVYECILAYTSAVSAIAPDVDTTYWIEVSPTNKWKCFDTSNSTQTAKATSFYYELTPGIACTAVSLQNVQASSVRIRMTDPTDGLVYDTTTSLLGTIPEASGWSYCFATVTALDSYTATDLPTYPSAVIRFDMAGGSDLAVGGLVIGQAVSIGLGTEKGARLGIQDYSITQENEFGDVVLVQRAYANRFEITFKLTAEERDAVYRLMATLRATPCVWIVSPTLSLFGFYKTFDIVIAYARYSQMSMTIQGMT